MKRRWLAALLILLVASVPSVAPGQLNTNPGFDVGLPGVGVAGDWHDYTWPGTPTAWYQVWPNLLWLSPPHCQEWWAGGGSGYQGGLYQQLNLPAGTYNFTARFVDTFVGVSSTQHRVGLGAVMVPAWPAPPAQIGGVPQLPWAPSGVVWAPAGITWSPWVLVPTVAPWGTATVTFNHPGGALAVLMEIRQAPGTVGIIRTYTDDATLQAVVSVEAATWGRIKALYQ